MEKLLEADLLTVDIGAIFRNQTAKNTASTPATQGVDNTQTVSDWGAELENRLTANKELSAEAREDESLVESRFFEEYFNTKWADEDVAKRLLAIGEPLKHVLKVLGFDEKINPILAFLLQQFVIEKLIKSGLLNAATFKAIYNSVAKKLVAHSQFLKLNNYNIIYYPDLYKRSASEMLEYLLIQSRILPPNASKYSKADLVLNKKVFLDFIENPAETFSERVTQIREANMEIVISDSEIASDNIKLKLNQIDLAKELEKKLANKKVQNSDTENEITSVEQPANNLSKKLDSPAKKLAAVQYLGMNISDTKIEKVLANDKFIRNLKEVSSVEMMKAALEISKSIPKNISAEEANDLIFQILSEL